MNDAPGVILTLRAVEPIAGVVRQPVTPTLVIRCNEGTLDAYVSVDRVLGERTGVRLRYDADSPFLAAGWTRSSDYTALFAPDPHTFIRGRLISADTFRIEVRPYDAAPIPVTFAPRGLAQHLPRIQQVCPAANVDSVTGLVDSATAFIEAGFDSLAAVIERHKTVTVENRKLGILFKSTSTTSLRRTKHEGCRATLIVVGVGNRTGTSTTSADLDFARLNPVPRIEEQAVTSGVLRSVRVRSGDGGKSIPIRASGTPMMFDAVDVFAPSAVSAQEIAGALTDVIAACQTSRQANSVEEVFLDFHVPTYRASRL